MRSTFFVVLLALLVVLSLPVFSHYPRHEFLDLPVGTTLGKVGSSSLAAFWDGEKGSFRISRSLDARLDITVLVTEEDLFSLGARFNVLQETGLLYVTCDVEAGTLRMIAGLPLGPVRLDWARTFGGDGERWILTTASFAEDWALVLGLEYGGEAGTRPILGVRLLPGFGLSAFIGMSGSELLLSLGGER